MKQPHTTHQMKKILTLLMSTLLISSAMGQAPDFQTPNAFVSSFVKDRLLYFGCGKTTKWAGVPKLEITASSPVLKAFVEQTFRTLCQAAGLTAAGEGTYHVFIGTREEFAKLKDFKHLHPLRYATDSHFEYTDDGHLAETIAIHDPSRIWENLFSKVLSLTTCSKLSASCVVCDSQRSHRS